MRFKPVPIEEFRWITVSNYELLTPLGRTSCTVEIQDPPGDGAAMIVLKPGEERRIRLAQIEAHKAWLAESGVSLTDPDQCRYIALVEEGLI